MKSPLVPRRHRRRFLASSLAVAAAFAGSNVLSLDAMAATTTWDTTGASTVSNLTATPRPNDPTPGIELSWTAPSVSSSDPVTMYEVYQDQTGLASISGNFTRCLVSKSTGWVTGWSCNIGGLAPGAHTYKVLALYASGKHADLGATVVSSLSGDVTAPSAVSGLTASATSDGAVLSWAPATDDRGVVRYTVTRQLGQVTQSSPQLRPLALTQEVTGTTATISGLIAQGISYTASVTPYDSEGNAGPARVVTFTPTGGTRPTSTARSTAVVLVNYSKGDKPWTPSQAQASFFGPANSVDSILRRSTDGSVGITGTVYGWVTAKPMTTGQTCTVGDGSTLQQAAAAAVPTLASFQSVVYVLSPNAAKYCDPGTLDMAAGWHGGWGVRETRLFGTLDPNAALVRLANSLNVGLHSTTILACASSRGVPMTLSHFCRQSTPVLREYRDAMDLPGQLLSARDAILVQHAFGVNGAVRAHTQAQSGTVNLRRRHVAGGPQLVRIPLGDTGRTLEVEMRSSTDDNGVPAAAPAGVQMRLARTGVALVPSETWTMGMAYPGISDGQRFLLDATLGTETFQDASFLAGMQLTDPTSGTTVTVTSVDASGVQLAVTIGDPAAQAPGTPLNLRVTAASSTSLTVCWDAPADNLGIAGYVVFESMGQPVLNNYSPGYAPYSSTEDIRVLRTNCWTRTYLSPSYVYPFKVWAVDEGGNFSATPGYTMSWTTAA